MLQGIGFCLVLLSGSMWPLNEAWETLWISLALAVIGAIAMYIVERPKKKQNRPLTAIRRAARKNKSHILYARKG